MPGILAKAALLTIVFIAVTSAAAQTSRNREPRAAEHPTAPPVSANKRDSIVVASGAFNGRPYWLALAECGGIYFKLNLLYTDAAVHARIKPDPKASAEYTKKLSEAIKTATAYFDGAERFLVTDRGIERTDAVLIYDEQSRAAGDRLKTIDAALGTANVCPPLYQACREAYPKECSDTLAPTS
jgi:hypothetical protein